MKTVQKIGFISTVAAALLFSGCDSSNVQDTSGDTTTGTTTTTNTTKIITVERGPLLDANVTDAEGHVAVEVGEGKYAFDHEPEYPVTANGGYIDVNYNGQVDAGEVKNAIELQTAEGNVITMASTVASDDNLSVIFENDFNITKEEVQTKTPKDSKIIEAFSNVLYKFVIDNDLKNPSEIDREDFKALLAEFKDTLERYRNDGREAAEHEQEVMDGLAVDRVEDGEDQEVRDRHDKKLKDNRENHKKFFEKIKEKFQENKEKIKEKFEEIKGNRPPFGADDNSTHERPPFHGDDNATDGRPDFEDVKEKIEDFKDKVKEEFTKLKDKRPKRPGMNENEEMGEDMDDNQDGAQENEVMMQEANETTMQVNS